MTRDGTAQRTSRTHGILSGLADAQSAIWKGKRLGVSEPNFGSIASRRLSQPELCSNCAGMATFANDLIVCANFIDRDERKRHTINARKTA